ncbi:Acetyltransferase (GNAT) family protein [Albimonas donghaensis]|uniref:Acetyltransferase (GNAT) family protein n=1 Tax=Albimonas donghaensis TaxID=356660 RepID=A0A1H2RF70_9RHOB|nr:GNAT family N-acetyltransferase [Albimonas donghaensis]SDW18102.1 Acetyltransferase (GNAT) family protein [Albimonas donghaensis]
MTVSTPTGIRPADAADAATVAFLLNEAASGFAIALWRGAAAPGENPWAIGAARMVTRMADAAVRVIDGPQGRAAAPEAAMIGYPIPAATEPGPDLPPAFLPLTELENLSAPSWYINALGVQPEARGRGLGARLLAEADALARAAELDAVSLIASDVNVGAIRLYERNGFEVVASRPKVGFEGWTPEGRDWLLMLRRGLG